ncbi:class I SAM-dependent methyltransferase [Pelagibius sp.]|uniref:class I SAM-dependent methyltransferase n=1 Tax=Pelagibius sp. TaxID=1931238 RepID=UPI002611D425|nr:class I SAM-dependent methyltransferase [Pelagibius sp.]
MRKPTRFWDRVAEGYAKKPVADEAAYQKKLQVTRGYFRPDMEVLEFGCGTGSTAIAHAPYVKHIRATDISAKMIEIAKGKAEAGKVGNVTFEQSSFDELQAPERSYDAVMGHSILHLLESKEDAIAKVHRLLKPGGVFVSSTVCIGDFMRWLRFIAPIGRFFGLMPLVKIFTEEDLVAALTAGGFAIDYRWSPKKGKGLFIVAKKVA